MRSESETDIFCAGCGCRIGKISGPMYSISNKGATYYSDVGYLCGQCAKEREEKRKTMRPLSAKDKAFESERVKYRQKIRELEREGKNAEAAHAAEMSKMKEQIRELEEKCRRLEQKNDKLLSYLDLTKEDLEKILAKDRLEAEAMSQVNGMFGNGSFRF